jgi:hypothetical protein
MTSFPRTIVYLLIGFHWLVLTWIHGTIVLEPDAL